MRAVLYMAIDRKLEVIDRNIAGAVIPRFAALSSSMDSLRSMRAMFSWTSLLEPSLGRLDRDPSDSNGLDEDGKACDSLL
jgi:hypothetical protein